MTEKIVQQAHILTNSTRSWKRSGGELTRLRVQVNSGGVRRVWSRHDLLSNHERLLRLKAITTKGKHKLSEGRIRLLERFSPECRERYIYTRFPDDLVAAARFFIGTLCGVGRLGP